MFTCSILLKGIFNYLSLTLFFWDLLHTKVDLKMNIISKQMFAEFLISLRAFTLGEQTIIRIYIFKKEDQKEGKIKLAFILWILGIISFLQISDRQQTKKKWGLIRMVKKWSTNEGRRRYQVIRTVRWQLMCLDMNQTGVKQDFSKTKEDVLDLTKRTV